MTEKCVYGPIIINRRDGYEIKVHNTGVFKKSLIPKLCQLKYISWAYIFRRHYRYIIMATLPIRKKRIHIDTIDEITSIALKFDGRSGIRINIIIKTCFIGEVVGLEKPTRC